MHLCVNSVWQQMGTLTSVCVTMVTGGQPARLSSQLSYAESKYSLLMGNHLGRISHIHWFVMPVTNGGVIHAINS